MNERAKTLEQRLAAFLVPERARRYTALTSGVVLCGYLVSVIAGPMVHGGFVDLASAIIGADFSAFYWAGHTVLHGRPDLLYDQDAQTELTYALIAPVPGHGDVHLFVSPPYWSLFFVPFAMLPYPLAVALLWVTSACLLFAMAHVLRNELPSLRAIGTTPRLVLLALCFFPVLFSFLNGQTSMIVLAPITAFFVLLRRQRDFAAGLMIGLLAVKPQLAFGPVIILVAARRWRALAGAAITAGLWLVLGLLLMPNAMATYRVVAPELFAFLRSEDYETWGQTSLYGLATLLIDPLSPTVGGLVGNLFVAAAAITNAVLVHRTPWTPGSRRWDLAIAGSIALGLISSPHLFLYDASLFVLPLAIVVARLDGEKEGALLDGGPVLVASALMAGSLFFGPYLTSFVQDWLVSEHLPRVALQVCTLAMLLFVVRIHQRAQREPSTC